MAKLSPEINQRIERQALGQALTSWDDLSYEQVLDSLRADGQTWNTNDKIMVWQALDENYAEYIAEHIEDVHHMLENLAEDLIEVERQGTIAMIRKTLENPALDTLPAKMALQVLVATLASLDNDWDGEDNE